MARSASAIAAVLVAAGAALLGGCDSTFDQNARLKLAAQREIAARTPHVVTQRTADVRVDEVTLLRDSGSTAVVARLRSTASRVLTDVPITVGVVRGRKKIALNRSPEQGWFQSHVPSIGARATVTWVFRSPPGRGTRPGDVPFVRVGAPATPAVSTATALPKVTAASRPSADAPAPTTPDAVLAPREPAAEGFTRVVVTNDSDFAQLGLPVVAVVRSGTRIVAAGVATLDELPAHASASVDVPLTGRAARGTVSATANPTIFD